MSASLNTLVDCALTKTVIAKENTDKFVIGGLLKVGSTTILLLREGVVEDRGGRKNNVYTYFFVNDRIMYSPTTSPYGYSSFPKEEN